MPGLLYRVFDDLSVSQFDERHGFKAGNVDRFDPNRHRQEAKRIVERQSDWYNRELTPLISSTDSYDHAVRLGEGKSNWAGGELNLRVAVIDPSALGNVAMYQMSKLMEITGANLSASPGPHEYVCVHRIPRRAVRRVYTFQEFIDHCSAQGPFCFRDPSECLVANGIVDR
jgi:hypothetical protein